MSLSLATAGTSRALFCNVFPQKLQELKLLMKKLGEIFPNWKMTALFPIRTDSKRARSRASSAAGVHVLYMLPLSSDHRAVINDMRSFAQKCARISCVNWNDWLLHKRGGAEPLSLIQSSRFSAIRGPVRARDELRFP